MFERFTEAARAAVEESQRQARALGHNYIGTEHLLLGLLSDSESTVAAKTLAECEIDFEMVERQVKRIVGQGDKLAVGSLPLTPRTKKVLELALREALSLGHNHIGTEHLLLGIVRENEGVAARILLDFDADAEKIRNQVIMLLSQRPEIDQRRVVAGGEKRRGIRIPFQSLDPAIGPPARAYPGDGACDLQAREPVTVAPGARAIVGCGFAIALPEGYAGLVLPRSGLAAKHGVTVLNSPGLIDAGYRGEVRVVLYNTSDVPFEVAAGDRVAQLMPVRLVDFLFLPVAELPESERGDGGFGSSGRAAR